MIYPIEEIIEEIRLGRIVIIIDEENRENEGDLILASDFVTPSSINFMIKKAKGLICLSLTKKKCNELKLPMMPIDNINKFNTNFTVSIESIKSITTGISTFDRSDTIKIASSLDSKFSDITYPGHIFPLKSHNGGILIRSGHTEAACELTGIAGLTPSAIICEIINNNGRMSNFFDLLEFSRKYSLKIGTISDLILFKYKYKYI